MALQNVKIKISTGIVVNAAKKASKKATAVFSQEVLKSSNFYARFDSGETVRSSLKASDFNNGILIWDTDYARRIYYTGTPSKSENPNAQKLWFTVAKNRHLKEWREIAKNAFRAVF